MLSTLFRRTADAARSVLLAATATVVTLAAASLDAQRATPPTGRVGGGLSLGVTEPYGDFAETTGNGFAAGLHAIFRVDDNAILNIRTDFGYVNYGNVRQRVPLSPTLGNLIRVDLTTSNNIVTFVGGPQLLGPTGTFTPYASALGGFSAFWTESRVEGTNNTEPFASTTNSSDFAWAYGGKAGVYIKVSSGDRPVRLDLGVSVLRHDDVTYLTANEIRNAFEDGRDPQAIRSRVDFLAYTIGIHIPFL